MLYKAVIISLLFIIIPRATVFSQTNMLTGQSSQSIPLAPGAVLQYSGSVAGDILRPNEISPAGVVGLGWKFGMPSISVYHNNTVDVSDDRWFFDDGYGNANEIIRAMEDNDGNSALEEHFYLKNSPLQKIAVIDNSPGTGELRIINGWVITGTNGTITRYGHVDGETDDALRSLPYWGNTIGKGIQGSAAPSAFYYRWDIKAVDNINGKRALYFYTAYPRMTTTGYSYTGQSYITEVRSPIGDKTTFEYGQIYPDNAPTNEGSYDKPIGDFDFTSTYFLRKVKVYNNSSTLLSDIQLTYTGDPGNAPHINSSKRGFAKRLLTGIQSPTDKSLNYLFTYDGSTGSNPGYLTAVKQVKSGATTKYTYGSTSTTLSTELSTGISKAQWANSIVVPSGNHLFCINNPSGDQLQFSILDRDGAQWKKTEINGVTDVLRTNAKIYPFGDYFVLNEKIDSQHKKWTLYGCIDGEWLELTNCAQSNTGGVNLDDKFDFPGNYLLWSYQEFSSYEFRIYGLPVGGDSWGNVASFSEGNKTNVVVHATPSYFIFSYRDSYSSTTYRFGKVFRHNGQAWTAGTAQPLYPETGSDVSAVLAFEDYYVIGKERTGAAVSDIAIRRWNPATQRWGAEYLASTDLETNTITQTCQWPRRIKLYGGPDYLVIHEPSNEDWMMIYRYQNTGSGNYQWVKTYIGSSGCGVPTLASSSHKFKNDVAHFYAKDFPTAVDRFICGPRQFAAIDKEEGYIWCFRWNGDESSGEWTSVINGINGSSGNDVSCQGLNLNSMHTFKDFYMNSENVGIYYSYTKVPSGIAYDMSILSYDYDIGKFKENGNTPAVGNNVKVALTNEIAAYLWPDDPQSSDQIVDLYQSCLRNLRTSSIRRMTNLVVDNGMGKNITTNYDYDTRRGKSVLNPWNGVLMHSFVTTQNGGGTTGKTTTEFSLDSAQGMFGQVFATTTQRSTQAAPPNDDTIRISGWLMEKDGYTPKSGWVRIRLLNNTTSALCAIDPRTGWFSVKMHKPSTQGQFSLDHVIVSDGSAYQMVFYVVTSTEELYYPAGGSIWPKNYIYGDVLNWENIKVNHATEGSSHGITEWNQIRRPNAFTTAVNFMGVMKYNIGKYRKAFAIRPVRTLTSRDGVTSVTSTPFEYYDEHNNMPGVAYTINSDNKIRASKTIFAHDKFSGMSGSGTNMLSQPAGSITYSTSLPDNINWETSAITIGPTQDPYTVPLFTGTTLSDLKEGDRIVVSAVHKLTGNYTDNRGNCKSHNLGITL